ncbi:MAG: cytidylate kinase-like family protein [Prevotella sp.]|nr:cytidylate kinase-like family protein [Prevotella sp.]MBR7054543.1 cytidylate kinase-like family protein [Prevotella sp.]
MDKQHIIINVGRQLGSGGRVIAQQLAKEFDCQFYDRELLNLAAKESGFSEQFFEQHDEHKQFFKSLFHLHAQHMSDNNFYTNKFSQESLFQFQAQAILKAASEGNCVFVGRCADYILRDMREAVSIFITADLDYRVAQVADRHGCDREAALKIIHTKESNRASYYNYYTGKKWGDSQSYDLCVNSTLLGLEGTTRLIALFINERMAILRKETEG